ncbi:AraC family transcriptional regulator [Stenotrophomonas maltophilia]|nr:AraC family transcriptional regulator [Stenotrophomonas maltophilia]
MKKVAIVAYEGCWAMSVFSVTDFFRIVSLLEKHLGLAQGYAVRVLSVDGAAVHAAGGHPIQPDGAIGAAAAPDLIVLPAIEGIRLSDRFAPDARLVAWLKARRRKGTRCLALTTGVSFLAAAGLAGSGLLATHWAFVGALQRLYPGCRFVANRPLVQADGLWTTGTLDGGFDALLEIVAQDRGDHFSQLCAAHLLVSDPSRLNPILPGHRNHSDEVILKMQDWIESHHAEAITIQRMACEVGLAERTLKRRFRLATKLSPNVYVQKVRVDKAKKLLLTTSMAMKEIAYAVGYENVSFFARLFRAQVGHTPTQWRQLHTVHRHEN